MHELRLHHVASGELMIGRRGEVLTALLGSCIAIGLIWREAGKCGLAHCLLPEAQRQSIGIGARFVSQAVPSLIRLMDIGPADLAQVEVVLAGGASMLGRAGIGNMVGRANVAAARQVAAQCGLRVCHEDLGGRRARRISIDCASHSFKIVHFERQEQEPSHAHH